MGINEKFNAFVNTSGISIVQALEKDWSDVQRCRLMSTMTSGPKVSDLSTYPFLQPFLLCVKNENEADVQVTVRSSESDTSLTCSRHSPESVVQSIQNLSKILHGECMDVTIREGLTDGELNMEHCDNIDVRMYHLKFTPAAKTAVCEYLQQKSWSSSTSEDQRFSPKPALFGELFPFHFLINQQCCLLQAGPKMKKLIPSWTIGSHPSNSALQVSAPTVGWDFERLSARSTSCVFLSAEAGSGEGLVIRGQFHVTDMDGAPALLFVGSPCLTTVSKLKGWDLNWLDLPAHDLGRELAMLGEKYTCVQEEMQNLKMDLEALEKEAKWMEQEAAWLEKEKTKTDAMCERLKDSLKEALSLQDSGFLNTPSPMQMDVGTPALMALGIIEKFLNGEKVSVKEAMEAHNAITLGGQDLHKPLKLKEMLGVSGMDADVNEALDLMLGASKTDSGWAEYAEEAEAHTEQLSPYELARALTAVWPQESRALRNSQIQAAVDAAAASNQAEDEVARAKAYVARNYRAMDSSRPSTPQRLSEVPASDASILKCKGGSEDVSAAPTSFSESLSDSASLLATTSSLLMGPGPVGSFHQDAMSEAVAKTVSGMRTPPGNSSSQPLSPELLIGHMSGDKGFQKSSSTLSLRSSGQGTITYRHFAPLKTSDSVGSETYCLTSEKASLHQQLPSGILKKATTSRATPSSRENRGTGISVGRDPLYRKLVQHPDKVDAHSQQQSPSKTSPRVSPGDSSSANNTSLLVVSSRKLSDEQGKVGGNALIGTAQRYPLDLMYSSQYSNSGRLSPRSSILMVGGSGGMADSMVVRGSTLRASSPSILRHGQPSPPTHSPLHGSGGKERSVSLPSVPGMGPVGMSPGQRGGPNQPLIMRGSSPHGKGRILFRPQSQTSPGSIDPDSLSAATTLQSSRDGQQDIRSGGDSRNSSPSASRSVLFPQLPAASKPPKSSLRSASSSETAPTNLMKGPDSQRLMINSSIPLGKFSEEEENMSLEGWAKGSLATGLKDLSETIGSLDNGLNNGSSSSMSGLLSRLSSRPKVQLLHQEPSSSSEEGGPMVPQLRARFSEQLSSHVPDPELNIHAGEPRSSRSQHNSDLHQAIAAHRLRSARSSYAGSLAASDETDDDIDTLLRDREDTEADQLMRRTKRRVRRSYSFGGNGGLGGNTVMSALAWNNVMRRTDSLRVGSLGSFRRNGASVEVEGGGVPSSSTAMVTASLLGHGHEHPVKEPHDKLAHLLSNIEEWQYDIFALEEATQSHALSVLGFALITRTEAFSRFNMDADKLARFLMEVESGYTEKNYHCASHGADVLRTMHVLGTRGGVWKETRCSEIGIIAMYLSALIHDYEHVGYNNDFLIKTHNELSIRYNDRSPMENHHVASAWALLREDRHNFVENMPAKAQEFLRKLVIECVLSTDMKQHFSLTSTFSSKAASLAPQAGPNSKPNSRAGSRNNSRPSSAHPSAGDKVEDAPPHRPPAQNMESSSKLSSFKAWDDDSRVLAMQMLLKTSDLGHLAGPLTAHLAWVQKLEKEMYKQGDEERALGLPISPLMDRESGKGVTKSQTGFLNFVALPLYKAMALAFPDCGPILSALMSNHKYWSEQEKLQMV